MKREPEQDERIRTSIIRISDITEGIFERISYTDEFYDLYNEKIAIIRECLNTIKSGYTSRNAEIEALKAEIDSMRCCGNCIYRFTCSSKENDTLGNGSCDNWTRRGE